MTRTNRGARTVLFITHGFPPMGGAGVQRVVKFIKYLPEFGWRPVVLTARHDQRDIAVPDSSLALDLPASLPVYRCCCPDPFSLYRRLGGSAKLGSAAFSEAGGTRGLSGRLAAFVKGLMVPDTKTLWLPGALAEARKIFARHPVDVIVSSSPWETVHLIAARLSKIYRTPWLADFRDPWTQASWNPPHPGVLNRLNDHLESMTLRNAGAVVVTSRTTADGFIAKYSGNNAFANLADKLHLIYNGYDEADFTGISPKRFDRFTIVYAGRAVMPGRTPEPLLAGLGELRGRRTDLAEILRVVFVGAPSTELAGLVARYGLQDVVNSTGYLPHRECLSYMLGADLLYLNTIRECIPGKFAEYLRADRPILGIMEPDCEVAGLIEERHAGGVIGPGDPVAIARIIEGRLEGKEPNRSKADDVQLRFSRKALTGQFAGLLKDVLCQHSGGCSEL